MKASLHFRLSFLLATCFALARLHAQSGTWTGAGADNNWSNAANWQSGVIPGTSGTATLLGTGTKSINFDGSGVGQFIWNGSGAFTIGGGAMQLSAATPMITNNALANLVINNDVTFATASKATLLVSQGSITLNGLLSASNGVVVEKSANAGTLYINGTTNAFTGNFGVQAGVAEIKSISDAGVASSIGSGTSIQLGNTATLKYTGGGDSTNRGVSFSVASSGTVGIQSEGTGAVRFTGTAGVVYSSGVGSKTLLLSGSNQGDNLFASVIRNNLTNAAASLAKSGSGTWTVSGSNTYTGATTVTGGTLFIDGNQSSATGAVDVATGATLGGKGLIGGVTTIAGGGVLAPGSFGDRTETLTFNNRDLSFSATNSKLSLDLDGTGAGSFDKIVGVSLLTLNGDLVFSINSNFGSSGTQSWDVLDFTSKTGDFNSVTLTGSYNATLNRLGDLWSGVSNDGSTWSFNQADGVIAVVPEPTALVSFLSGFGMLLLLRRKR